MEFEDPGYSDEVMKEFEKICEEIEEQRRIFAKQISIEFFGKELKKYCH